MIGFGASALLAAGFAGTAWSQETVTPSVQGYPFGKEQKWLERFDAKRALAAEGGFDVVFLGDSVTHGWEGRERTSGRRTSRNVPTNADNNPGRHNRLICPPQ